MTDQEYATSDWRVTLPADWQHRHTNDGVVYFESADARYGLYVSVWNIGTADRSPDEVAQEFLAGEQAALDALPEHAWAHAAHATGPGETLLDSLEQGRRYRVLGRFIARPPRVLRATFHDYDCRDLAESTGLLAPLLEHTALTP